VPFQVDGEHLTKVRQRESSRCLGCRLGFARAIYTVATLDKLDLVIAFAG
jgi:hypothetical protein